MALAAFLASPDGTTTVALQVLALLAIVAAVYFWYTNRE